MYSPLWKITVFSGRLFGVGAYFGKYGNWKKFIPDFKKNVFIGKKCQFFLPLILDDYWLA